MAQPRLEVHDVLGDRVVTIDKVPFTIGRRENNDLRLGGTEVSRDHAEIVGERGRFRLRDRKSRYGTYVNGACVNECDLRSGDLVRLGRGGGADLVFLGGGEAFSTDRTVGARDDLRRMTALLESMRALGSGRVLDDVLALVLDAAIEVSEAERAFIMLAGEGGALDFKLGREQGRQPLTAEDFKVSHKIPEDVFRTGQARAVTDLTDRGIAGAHEGTVALGIRHVVCVPLIAVQYVEPGEKRPAARRLGVLYLDSREKGALLSEDTRAALDALAGEASVAIENAELYRDKLERARLEHEMQIAAEIQRALLPTPRGALGFVEASAAATPARSIGGDFFDYLDQPGRSFGFTLGDVAGKGPPAALLSALMQGLFASQALFPDGPASAVANMNKALCLRGIEARFVTLIFGVLSPAGQLTYCNAGHNPALIIGRAGLRRLDRGGPVLGLMERAPFEQETLQLEPGDTVVLFSDGVSEALSAAGEEFGEDRIRQVAEAHAADPVAALVDRLVDAVGQFATGTSQHDDVTVMVVRYKGV